MKPKFLDTRLNGMVKRSSLVTDGLPTVKGSTGTVTLGRQNSLDGATHTQGSHSETMQNGHTSSTKYVLPPIV